MLIVGIVQAENPGNLYLNKSIDHSKGHRPKAIDHSKTITI